MARLRLSLLGGVQITSNVGPVGSFTYNKARALLAYLAVEADRPHQRDTLVGLLWPNLPDAAARTNLRQALANLRQAIGDTNATPPFLLITRDTIQFNSASDYNLDVSSFTTLLATCDAHAHRHLERCRSCAARLEQAAALYRGDFLAGFSVGDSVPFEEWLLRQRERLQQGALDSLARLADYHEWRGDDELARGFAQRQLDLDPWREEAHRQLMRLLARGSQRSAALAQYETCRRILARDLGVEPEAATTALYERIRAGASSEFKMLSSELPGRERETQNSKPWPEPGRRLRTQNLQNFPAQTSLLIGREAELTELGTLLENPAHRLITIVGPGGMGKTRLALAASTEQAEAFTHRAVFVPLQAISGAEFVAPAILSALDIPLQGQRDPREQLLHALRAQELLLVLDNFEQLLTPDQSENEGGVALLRDILHLASGVTLLVTSRERLALPGEWLFDLEGLSYPADEITTGIEGYGAVRLFVERASQVRRQAVLADGEITAVARICRLVEGLPLAIELAAAGLRTRSYTAIATAIETSLSAFTSGLRAVPERHRSIRATFEHSWRLLSEEERQVFVRLSVFRGGFQEEAASDVAQASPLLLASLVDKSLLRWDGKARYDMHELVRQYAGEKLEQAGEVERTRNQHAAYFLALAETAEPKLLSTARGHWLERLEQDHDNLRAVLAWSQVTMGAGEIGLRLVGALGWFWMHRDYLSEGRAWAEAVLTAAGISGQPRARASALHSAGMLAWIQGDHAVASNRLMESLRHWRQTDDRRGLAVTLSIAGMEACNQYDYRAGDDFCAESVALMRDLGEPWVLAWVLYFFGNAAFNRSDYTTAGSRYEESLALFRTLDDPWGLAAPLMRLGMIACKQGEYMMARVLLEESVAIRRQIGQKQLLAHSVVGLAEVALCQRENQEAVAHLTEGLALYQEIGMFSNVVDTLGQFARVAANQAQPDRAARLYSACKALAEQPDEEPNVATIRAQLGEAAFAAAWAEGRSMTLEQAIAYALEGSVANSVGS